MTSSSPPAPDYAAAAQAQGQASMDVTNTQNFANRPDINTPFGSQWWTTAQDVDPATGQLVTRWQQNNALTDPYQKALDSQMSIAQGRSDAANAMLGDVTKNATNPMDWNSFQAMGQGPQQYASTQAPDAQDTSGLQTVDPSQRYYDKAGDAVYNQFARRQDPLFQQQNDSLKQNLYNSGLKEGDEAFDKAMLNQKNQQSDARQNAMDSAVQASGSEAQRMQGMDLSTRQNQFGEGSTQYQQKLQGANFNSGQNQQQFQNQATGSNYQNLIRQQQIAEALQKRNLPLNQMNALLSGQQVGQQNMPDFNKAGVAQTPDLMGAAQSQYGAALGDANAQNANNAQWIGTGMTVGAMML